MKIRKGYVSNSSSSSFVLHDKKDLGRVVELFNDFIKKINVKKYWRTYTNSKTSPTKQNIRDEFLNSFTKQKIRDESLVTTEYNSVVEHFEDVLSSLFYCFVSFYRNYFRLKSEEETCFDCIRRKGFICKEKSCDNYFNLFETEIERKEFLKLLKGCPRPFPKELILESKKRSEISVLGLSPYKYLTSDEMKLSIDIWLKNYPNAISGSFGSDGDSKEQYFIREHLCKFYEFCKKSGVNCSWSDNS